MASIIEDWNGVASGGMDAGAYGGDNNLDISLGDGMDANVYSLSQVTF